MGGEGGRVLSVGLEPGQTLNMNVTSGVGGFAVAHGGHGGPDGGAGGNACRCDHGVVWCAVVYLAVARAG